MIKFGARPGSVPPSTWKCGVCNTPKDRARGTDGIWTNECVSCYAKFLKCIADWKAKKNPTWFLGKKKETKP